MLILNQWRRSHSRVRVMQIRPIQSSSYEREKRWREGRRENHRAPLKRARRNRDEEGGSAREYREGENIEQSCIND